jgi:hypothetical protein
VDRDIARPSEKSASVTCVHVIGVVVSTGREVSRGRLAVLRLLCKETSNSVTPFEETAPAGTETTFHLHRNCDEVAHALSGVEPLAPRVGQLLQRRLHQQGVSRARHMRGYAAAPVVAVQAQRQATRARELSILAPLRVLQARTSDPARPRPVSARLADEEEPGGDVPGRGGNRSSCPFADLCMVTLIATAAITDFGRI